MAEGWSPMIQQPLKISYREPLIVFFVAASIRVPSLFVPYYNIDELTNALFARFINDGELTLRDFLGNTYILTHYLYAVILKICGPYNLRAVHAFHMVWIGLTAVSLYLAGRELTQRKSGALAASLFYAIFSITFYAKDFQASLAESFSLLPCTLGALCFFRGVPKRQPVYLFLTGFFVGLGSLFKAPAGVMIVPVWLTLLLGVTRSWSLILMSLAGLLVALGFPFLFSQEISVDLRTALNTMFTIQETYIQAYDDLSFIYWFSKYLIRTWLIAASALPLWYFALGSVGRVVMGISFKSTIRRSFIFFLFVWLLCDWFAVVIGKRVFFHYFVFLFPPLCLLAAYSVTFMKRKDQTFFAFIRSRRMYVLLSIVGLASFGTYFSDGILRWSLQKRSYVQVLKVIEEETGPSDRIYVWGMIPDFYFFSERQPASTMIWAGALAGFSSGSPAMEYMRATGQTLTLPESVRRDFLESSDDERPVDPLLSGGMHPIDDKELLSLLEIIEHIDSPSWRKLMWDFLRRPPVLFLDTSPTGVRGFGHYPIEKYDILKRFISDNYDYLRTVEGVIIYRLRGT